MPDQTGVLLRTTFGLPGGIGFRLIVGLPSAGGTAAVVTKHREDEQLVRVAQKARRQAAAQGPR